jgi:hypothetical protein
MNYYQTIFAVTQHHKWSIWEVESLIPWERDIYFKLLENHIKEQNDKIRQQMNGQ